MKKIIALLCLLAVLTALAACSEDAPEGTTSQPVSESTQAPTQTTAPETTTQPETESTPDEPELSFGAVSVSTFRDEYGTIYAQAIVPVKNNGSQPVQLSQAVMEFLDEDGACVFRAESVMAFPDVIAPGESAWFFEQVAPEMVDTQRLSAELSSVEATPCEEPLRFATGNTSLRASPYGGLILTGTVTNPTDYAQELCCVAAVLYDEAGSPLAVIYTVLMETLEADSTLDFTIEHYLLPGELTVDAVADYALFAYPMQ